MTKKKYYFLFLALFIAVTFFFMKKRPAPLNVKALPMDAKTVASPVNVDSRTVIDQQKKTINRIPSSIGYVNVPSPDWQEKFESSMREQGGDSLKEIKIVKERSLVWMRDENPLLVESVVVTLLDQQDVKSSFRALVDSQTGKVLETWDRTIVDPINVRDGLKIKLDPRYSN